VTSIKEELNTGKSGRIKIFNMGGIPLMKEKSGGGGIGALKKGVRRGKPRQVRGFVVEKGQAA